MGTHHEYHTINNFQAADSHHYEIKPRKIKKQRPLIPKAFVFKSDTRIKQPYQLCL